MEIFLYNIKYYNQRIIFDDKIKNIDDLIIQSCLHNKKQKNISFNF